MKAKVLGEDKIDFESYRNVLRMEVKKTQEHVSNNQAAESDLLRKTATQIQSKMTKKQPDYLWSATVSKEKS